MFLIHRTLIKVFNSVSLTKVLLLYVLTCSTLSECDFGVGGNKNVSVLFCKLVKNAPR